MTTTLTRPTSTANQAGALEHLPQANVRRPGDFSEEEFETIPDVPVFAEHETVTREGQPIKFGLEELSAVVDRCNRRIDETGDYAAVTIGHTPSPEDKAKGAADPPVIGYAGPFRIGVLGQSGVKRYAILADLHIYRDELREFRRHPRRSPEVWLEDRFSEMFLDPIALLGAEAPRLDLGLQYVATYHGRQVMKYAAAAAAAVAPGPANVFIPSDKPLKHAADSGFSDWSTNQQPSANSEDAPMPLTPQDVEQIVDAMDRLDWVQWVKGQMQQQASPGPGAATPGAASLEGGAGEGAPPAPAGVGGDRPSPPVGASPPSEPAAPEVKKNAGDANPDMNYPAAPRQFSAGDGLSDEERAEREEYARLKKKYGGDADSEYREVPAGGSRESINIPPGGANPERNSADRRNYEAGGSSDGDNPNRPGESTVDPDGQRPGEGTAAGPTSDGAEPYRRGGPRERYAREDHVLRLERDNQTLRQQLGQLEERNVDSERYARLQTLRHHFAFDFDRTVDLTKYGKMTPEQFEAQCELIEANCRPIPLGQWLPTGDDAAAAQAPDRPGRGAQTEKYSRDVSQRALQICEAAAVQGKEPNYERVLADLQAGREPVI